MLMLAENYVANNNIKVLKYLLGNYFVHQNVQIVDEKLV